MHPSERRHLDVIARLKRCWRVCLGFLYRVWKSEQKEKRRPSRRPVVQVGVGSLEERLAPDVIFPVPQFDSAQVAQMSASSVDVAVFMAAAAPAADAVPAVLCSASLFLQMDAAASSRLDGGDHQGHASNETIDQPQVSQ